MHAHSNYFNLHAFRIYTILWFSWLCLLQGRVVTWYWKLVMCKAYITHTYWGCREMMLILSVIDTLLCQEEPLEWKRGQTKWHLPSFANSLYKCFLFSITAYILEEKTLWNSFIQERGGVTFEGEFAFSGFVDLNVNVPASYDYIQIPGLHFVISCCCSSALTYSFWLMRVRLHPERRPGFWKDHWRMRKNFILSYKLHFPSPVVVKHFKCSH